MQTNSHLLKYINIHSSTYCMPWMTFAIALVLHSSTIYLDLGSPTLVFKRAWAKWVRPGKPS